VTRKYRICFFAGIRDREYLRLMQWYRNDIRILESISTNLTIATKLHELPLNCDLYFAWWPTKSIFVLLLSKLLRKPVIIVAGGSEVVNAKAFDVDRHVKGFYSSQPYIFKQVIKTCLRHGDKTLAVSEHLKEQVEALGGRNVDVIYHGIDTDEIFPDESKDKEYILTISHLNKENVSRKCIHTIINAIPYVLKEIPHQKFVIAGSHLDGFEELERKVRELNIKENVEFPGKISNERRLDYFQRSLAYIQPTLHEAFGVAIAEAMACEVSVISSRVGAVPEVVGDSGLYVDPKDPFELSQKIILLLKDKQMRKELGRKGRERIVNIFSFSHRKNRLIEIIEELMEGQKCKPSSRSVGARSCDQGLECTKKQSRKPDWRQM